MFFIEMDKASACVAPPYISTFCVKNFSANYFF
jgi:hypothetical protein